ncbi:unnamed protein product [Danaus chrysippus]|uniref:(African queen) hypothetical protein n=1 Tax=Danaus chrysippus TaxID=151541 RepID=A0A8J2QXM1_9NEOP|nr:unnamed protein product [Danaus chrysippus]
MDWTNDVVLRFLELYQMHPCIWDPRNVAHKNKTKVDDAWCVIKKELGFPGTIKELKRKRESLMSAYRGYKTKIKKSVTNSGSSDVYRPTWFAFDFMDSFLAPVYTCKPPLNTEVTMTTARKQQNPSELEQVKNQMDKAFKIIETASQRQLDDDDECNIFGKLISKKLRRLPVDKRDLMMRRINNMIYEEIINMEDDDDGAISSPMRSYPSRKAIKVEDENYLTFDVKSPLSANEDHDNDF